jgi:hypothetical protein
MRKFSLLVFIPLLIMLISGCGGNSTGPGTPLTIGVVTTPVSLTVTDTPPLGVQVLFFQLSITGAMLQPGNASLLNSTNPVPVNVSQLQTETAFLGTANVATGTYTSLVLTFSNPQLTIFNGTSSTLDGCAAGTVCQVTPTPPTPPATSPLSLTFSSAPVPVTVAANTPLAFKLDIHLNTVIQPDLSLNLAATNGVSIAQLPSVTSGPVAVLGNLIGTVESLGTNQFTLQTGDGRTFTIDVNSGTTYSGFPSSACSSENFSCLAAPTPPTQIVKVAVSLQTGGTLLATSVTYQQPATQQVVDGNIVGLSTSGGNTVMQMILQNGPPTSAALPFGGRAVVTVPNSGVTFSVDSGGFTIPGGLSFASASDLSVGQEVQVVVTGSVTSNGSGSTLLGPLGPTTPMLTTNSVALEPTQITGTVEAIYQSNSTFTLQTFPNFFLPPGPTAVAPTFKAVSITVQATGQTTYQNLSPENFLGIPELGVVSVEGWLFSTPIGSSPATTIAASGVVGRPGPIPLF